MKRSLFQTSLFLIYFFGNATFGYTQTSVDFRSLNEGFENGGSVPLNWTVQYVKGAADWKFQYGGFTPDPAYPLSKKPMKPHTGNFNAIFQLQSLSGEATKLITPQITGLKSYGIHPVLKFWHAQGSFHGTDQLRVYFRTHKDSAWVLLNTYIDPTETPDSVFWVERDISLPVSRLSDTYYIAFEGTTKWGYGVCIDDVSIIETGVEQKKLKSVTYNQPVVSPIPIGTKYNEIARIDLMVSGNTGSLILNSMGVQGLNSDLNDIASNGVKLYLTTDSTFSPDIQLGTSQDFVSNRAFFGSLNYDLPIGASYLWVTYDISNTAMANHFVDIIIPQNSINVNGSVFPSVDISPPGNRELYETIFVDDFETDKGWALSGEFERDKPKGLGGSMGSPDPTYAFSGYDVLGTDLTGLNLTPGDYEKNLGYKDYQAISPTINVKYYNNLQLSFYRWLNIDHDAVTTIDYSINEGSTWNELWRNNGIILESKWSQNAFKLPVEIERQSQVKFRFTLGQTSNYWQFSGWNIDDFVLTGDHITSDVGVTEWISPQDACSMSSASFVKVKIKNYGDGPTSSVIPVAISLDNGVTFLKDTLFQSIPKDGTAEFTFRKSVDLSRPDIYNIIVKTMVTGDKGPENDYLLLTFYSFPVHNLPYADNFDGQKILWKSEGKNESWEWGTPAGSIMEPLPSAPNIWVTNLSGDYYFNDSSWVVSPCFNFTNIDKPIIDFKFWNQSESRKDGTVLQYSKDGGTSWQDVPKHNYSQWNWNWYNDDNIASLEGQGWDTITNGWFRARQFLPSDLANQTQVRFRYMFRSDNSNENSAAYKGFGFDDFRIYSAPYDVGVDTIVNINPLECQSVDLQTLSLKIKNYGLRDLQVNDTMIVGVKVNNEPVVIDTFKLQTSILVGESKLVTLHKRVPIINGNYTVKAFTMIDMEPGYYGTNNDTAKLIFAVNPQPVSGLRGTYYTARLDTLLLKPVFSSDNTYHWAHNTDNAYSTNYLASDVGSYYLTITNSLTTCQTIDTISVYALKLNIGVDQIIDPVTNCSYGTAFKPVISIHNYGTDTLAINRTIPLKLRINSNGIVNDNVVLYKALAPDSSIRVTLNIPLDLSAPGNYQLMVSTDMSPYDVDSQNDSIKNSFSIYGYPSVELGPDVYVKALNYLLTAPAGYDSYAWSDGSGNNSLLVTSTGKYNVTVTNTHLCETKDSIFVRLGIHDLMVKRLVSPVNSCTLPGLTSISCKLVNNGTDTIKTSESIPMSYEVNTGASASEMWNPATNLLPGDSVTFTFATRTNLSVTSTYEIKVKGTAASDLRRDNDSIIQEVKVYGNPVVNLGNDKIVHDYEEKLRAGAGYIFYRWQDNSADSTYLITQTHLNPLSLYSVTVTDQFGCQDQDTIYVYFYVDDLSLKDIQFPVSTCTKATSDTVKVKVTNTGNTVVTNKDVIIRYSLNGAPEVSELFKFTGQPNDSMVYTFLTPVKLTQLGLNSIKGTIEWTGDVRRNNDTLTHFLDVQHGPIIDFGAPNDTLHVDMPYTLDAGAGTNYTYAWNTNETTQTISATVSNKKYTVTVTDAGCIASRDVVVVDNFYDLAVTGSKLVSTTCQASKKQPVSIIVENVGNMNLTGQPIVIKYQVNSEAEKTKNVNFTGNFQDATVYYFEDSLDMSQAASYAVKLGLDYTQDKATINNTRTENLSVVGIPSVNLGGINDTIKTTSWPVVLDAGSGTDYSYTWDNGSHLQTRAVSLEGWFGVEVSNGTCVSNDTVFVRFLNPVTNIMGQALLVIRPNPVHENFYVDLTMESVADVTIDLISSAGKMITSRQLSGSRQYEENFDVSGLPGGVYYVRVYGKDWVRTEKIMKQ